MRLIEWVVFSALLAALGAFEFQQAPGWVQENLRSHQAAADGLEQTSSVFWIIPVFWFLIISTLSLLSLHVHINPGERNQKWVIRRRNLIYLSFTFALVIGTEFSLYLVVEMIVDGGGVVTAFVRTAIALGPPIYLLALVAIHVESRPRAPQRVLSWLPKSNFGQTFFILVQMISFGGVILLAFLWISVVARSQLDLHDLDRFESTPLYPVLATLHNNPGVVLAIMILYTLLLVPRSSKK